jgi:hypothetical protein
MNPVCWTMKHLFALDPYSRQNFVQLHLVPKALKNVKQRGCEKQLYLMRGVSERCASQVLTRQFTTKPSGVNTHYSEEVACTIRNNIEQWPPLGVRWSPKKDNKKTMSNLLILLASHALLGLSIIRSLPYVTYTLSKLRFSGQSIKNNTPKQTNSSFNTRSCRQTDKLRQYNTV